MLNKNYLFIIEHILRYTIWWGIYNTLIFNNSKLSFLYQSNDILYIFEIWVHYSYINKEGENYAR